MHFKNVNKLTEQKDLKRIVTKDKHQHHFCSDDDALKACKCANTTSCEELSGLNTLVQPQHLDDNHDDCDGIQKRTNPPLWQEMDVESFHI